MAGSAESTIQAEMAAAPTPSLPQDAYRERLAYFIAIRNGYNRRRYRWANLSAVAALVGLALLLAAIALGAAWAVAGLVVIALAVVAFVRQARLDETYLRYVALCKLSEEGLARLRREWSAMTLWTGPERSLASDALNVGDLDLLGHASTQHLLNTVTSPQGQSRLIDWLLEPAPPSLARERQAAARELAPRLNLRDELSVFGRLSNMQPEQFERFLAWSEDAPWLRRHPWLNVWSVVAPVALALLVIAQLTGLLPGPWWLLVVAVNMGVIQLQGKPAEAQVERVAESQGVFLPYAGVFAYVRGQTFTAPLLQRTHQALASVGGSADARLRSLGRIMRFADLRLSVIGPLLQIGFFWNIHSLRMLERWRAATGPQAREWFETLAEMEALAGLAALSFDHPDWVFPELRDTPGGALEARGLGHPLLPPERCVRNDVIVGPPGRFLLVTGSNMSGKSTLLRAIGVNVTLAQAGAPVCAEAMSLPPISLATSMRAQDSLEAGVSYFMAELRQLKQVVDALRAVAETGERVPMFLLDEILSGTNTGERQIAARTVIRYLLDLGATGAVSTHDLSLAQAEDLTPVSEPAHFTERFTRGPEGPAMTFDYTLRPGIATSVNALKLMEIVGLPTPQGVDEAPATGTAR